MDPEAVPTGLLDHHDQPGRERRPDRAIETNVEFWAAVPIGLVGGGTGLEEPGGVYLRILALAVPFVAATFTVPAAQVQVQLAITKTVAAQPASITPARVAADPATTAGVQRTEGDLILAVQTDGRQLTTVEGLSPSPGELHPIPGMSVTHATLSEVLHRSGRSG